MITVVRSHQVASEWVVRVGLCHSPAGARDKDYRAGDAGGQHYCPQIFQGNLLVHLDGYIWMGGWMDVWMCLTCTEKILMCEDTVSVEFAQT